MVHVTNRGTPPGEWSDNPGMAYGRRQQLITASMVRVTNVTPGTDNPNQRPPRRVPVPRRGGPAEKAAHEPSRHDVSARVRLRQRVILWRGQTPIYVPLSIPRITFPPLLFLPSFAAPYEYHHHRTVPTAFSFRLLCCLHLVQSSFARPIEHLWNKQSTTQFAHVNRGGETEEEEDLVSR
jgi:hypothetical protein